MPHQLSQLHPLYILPPQLRSLPLKFCHKGHIALQRIALVTLQNLDTLWEHHVCTAIKMEILTWSTANVVLSEATSAYVHYC